MIPDELLPTPLSGGYGQTKTADKGCNLIKEKCAQCGEVFYRHNLWNAYKRVKNGRVLRMCTWRCACRWEEAQEARERPKNGRKKRSKEQKQARIDELMRDMAKIRALLDSEAGQAMSQEDRNRERSKIRWRACEMRRLLEEMDDETGKPV